MTNKPTYEDLQERIGELEEQVSACRQRVEALAAREERFLRLSENLPVAIYSAHPDKAMRGFYLAGNVDVLTGYSKNQFLEDASLFARIIHPQDLERVNLHIRSALRQKKTIDLEYRIFTRDGQVKWIRDRGRPVYDQDRLLRVDGVMEDISEKRLQHETIKAASRTSRTSPGSRQATGSIASCSATAPCTNC